MEYYGYDLETKHLFASDKQQNITYCGRIAKEDLPVRVLEVIGDSKHVSWGVGPEDWLETTPEIAIWIGSYYLSGIISDCPLTIKIDNNGDLRASLLMHEKGIWSSLAIEPNFDSLGKKYPGIQVCIGGVGCSDPQKVTKIARCFPFNRVFVSRLGDAGVAFGSLIANMSKTIKLGNKKISFDTPNTEDIEECDFIAAKSNLKYDIMGQLSQAIQIRGYAVNDVFNTIGISAFYGKTLSRNIIDGKNGCFIVPQDHVDKFFPEEVVSVKYGAGFGVPVVMKCSDKFRDITGWKKQEAIVKIISKDDGFHMMSFIGFNHQFLSQAYVISYDVGVVEYPKDVIVVRHEKAYKVSKEYVVEKYNS